MKYSRVRALFNRFSCWRIILNHPIYRACHSNRFTRIFLSLTRWTIQLKRKYSRREVSIGVSLTFLVSCASTDIAPINPSEGTGVKEADEMALWTQAGRLEHQLAGKEVIYQDAGLNAYLTGIMAKLFPTIMQASATRPRIYILQSPHINAFALPNGAIYITTGLLAKMDNEAQLATVLGHEFTHYQNRHALKELHQAQNQQKVGFVISLILAGAASAVAPGAVQPSQFADLTQLWTLSAVTGYSRELETEADQTGLRAMATAGYDPKESIRVFEKLSAELKGQGIEEPYFFASHPKLQERIDTNSRLLEKDYAGVLGTGRLHQGADEYLNHIQAMLLVNAALDIDLHRLESARTAIGKSLMVAPDNARAHFLLGEVYRHVGTDRASQEKALAEYIRATQLPDTPAEAYKEIGLLYREWNRQGNAKAAFKRYLDLKPNAVDAPIIKSYMIDFHPS